MLLLVALGVGIWAVSLNGDLSDQKDATAQAQQQAADAQQQVETVSGQVDDLTKQVGDASDQIDQAGSAAQDTVDGIKDKLTTLGGQIKDAIAKYQQENPEATATAARLSSASAARAEREQAEVARAGHRVAAVCHVELAVDAAQVRLDRVRRDEQLGGDLAVGERRREVAQDRLLALAQRLEQRRDGARAPARGRRTRRAARRRSPGAPCPRGCAGAASPPSAARPP